MNSLQLKKPDRQMTDLAKSLLEQFGRISPALLQRRLRVNFETAKKICDYLIEANRK